MHEALAAQPGERILDVGCGPGFYVAELLEAVGPEGSVVGVDVSPAMLAIAAHRTEANPNAAFHETDATSLPVEGEDFDAALSVQVLEYVSTSPLPSRRSTVRFALAAASSCGTSTGQRSRGTRRTRSGCGAR